MNILLGPNIIFREKRKQGEGEKRKLEEKMMGVKGRQNDKSG